MTADSRLAETSINITRLRYAMGALTLLLAVAFIAVGAIAPVVLCAVVGGAITALLGPGRTLVVALAGLAGLAVVALCINLLAGDGPSDSWGDWLFLIGGGLLGLAVVVLAGVSLAGGRRS